MDSFNTKLARIETAKNNIKQALINKGAEVGDNIEDYSEAINNIKSGSGDVKLFETVEDMQADPTAKEGDLAVIYRNEVKNATADSKFQIATFPETVVLDTAITDSIEVRYRAVDGSMFDCMGSLDSSMFMMDCYSESGEVRIEYTSSDGITYTRTDTLGNPVDFGTEIYYERTEMWNDTIGKFIQIGGSVFEGLYQYDSKHISTTDFALLPTSGVDIANEIYTGKPVGRYNTIDIGIVVKAIKTELGLSVGMNMAFGTMDSNPIVCFFVTDDKSHVYNCSLCYDRTNKKYQISTSWNYVGNVYIYQLDLTNHTYTLVSNTPKTLPSGFFYVNVLGNLDSLFVNASLSEEDIFSTVSKSSTGLYTSENGKNAPLILLSGTDIETGLYLPDPKYLYASTQLTATSDYVYEKEFYGKNGVGTGTLQNKENLTKKEVQHRVNIWSNYNSGIVCPTNSSGLFNDCKNLTTIPLLNAGNVTNMSDMFRNCVNLTTIPLLNTSSATNMGYMFDGCTNLTTIPLLDTSNVTNMSHTFSYCEKLTTIPLLDTNKVTNMGSMFSYCKNLTTIPLLDTGSVANMSNTFNNCTSLTTIPLLDTSGVTDMSATFYYCTSLTTIPLLNTSSVTDTRNMFDHCKNLTTIPLLNTSKVTMMGYMFAGCESLTEIPLLDTSSVTDMGSMFVGCANLTTVPVLNISSVTYMYNMFLRCPSLSDESLNNILAMCKSATSYTGTKTLKYIGLTSEQATKCTTLSNYNAFTSAGWTIGY